MLACSRVELVRFRRWSQPTVMRVRCASCWASHATVNRRPSGERVYEPYSSRRIMLRSLVAGFRNLQARRRVFLPEASSVTGSEPHAEYRHYQERPSSSDCGKSNRPQNSALKPAHHPLHSVLIKIPLTHSQWLQDLLLVLPARLRANWPPPLCRDVPSSLP